MFKSVETNIEAYILATDPISFIQNISFNSIPNVNGEIKYISPKDWDSVLSGHRIQNIINSFK